MSDLERFAEGLSTTLDGLAISTYDLARLITARYGDQGAKTYVEGSSRDALDDYRRGRRPPKRRTWGAIRTVLKEQGDGLRPEALQGLDELHEEALRHWNKQKKNAGMPETLLGIRFKGRWPAAIGCVLALALLAWIFRGAQSDPPRSPVAPKTPSQISGQARWANKSPTSQLKINEVPLWRKIDRADVDESFKTYEYYAVVPTENRGNAMRLGIAGADAKLELLLYKNGKFFESRYGTDIHMDFTQDNAIWVRIRNWNRQDVEFLLYLIVRPRN